MQGRADAGLRRVSKAADVKIDEKPRMSASGTKLKNRLRLARLTLLKAVWYCKRNLHGLLNVCECV